MSDTEDALRDVGPWGQATALSFRFLFLAILVVAAGWLVSNFREIPPDSQAVVMRFGNVVRVQGAGLLMAWPRPIEQITLLPASARQIQFRIARFTESPTTDPTASGAGGYDLDPDPRRNSGFLLSGDSSVVHLEAQLFYQITDPVAYMIAAEHVGPALERLFVASAISVTAGRDLDSILVARPEIASQISEAQRRERLRADLLNAVNNRLEALARQGAGLGITVSRVDLVPSIPAGAKEAFDSVLVVTQAAETSIAEARTVAQNDQLQAEQQKDSIATSASAAAEEIISEAQTQTTTIAADAEESKDMARNMQMARLYYDRVEPLLKKAGSVEVIDSKGGIRTILPGGN